MEQNIIDLDEKKKAYLELEKKIIRQLAGYIKKGLNLNESVELTMSKLKIEKEKKEIIEVIYKRLYNDFNNKRKHLEKYEKKWYSISEKGKVSLLVNALAEYIVEKYSIIMVPPVLHFYANGVYKPLTDTEIKTFIKLELEEEFKTPGYINQVFILITEMSANIVKDIDEFDSNKDIINFKNGLFNMKTGELIKHDKTHLSLFQLNCNYNPIAQCPVWDNFIKEALKNDTDTISALEEALGYMCVKDIRAQKMFVLHGKSNTGKSVVLSLYKYIIGGDMYTSTTLQELSRADSKVVHQLRGKLANVCGDLPQKAIEDTGLLKQLTGEDELTADIKFKEAITFKNYARLLFSCNEMPTSYSDKSTAFYNRLLIIPFNNVVDEKDMDRELKDKLYAECEGIVLKLIEALKRLRDNKYVFTKSEAIENELSEYKKKNDNVLSFLKDIYKIVPVGKYENDPAISIKKYGDLYTEYTRYCQATGLRACNKKIFKDSIIRNPEIVYKEKHNSVRSVIMNLKLNDDYDDYDTVMATLDLNLVEDKSEDNPWK